MTRYRASDGRTIVLGKRLGSGGEGSVYEIEGSPNQVAKIYEKKRVSADHSVKLAAMIRHLEGTSRQQADAILRIAAWPMALITSDQGQGTAGVVLPRVDAKPIHELYSPSVRKHSFPAADWRFLFRVARNCASAFDTLHSFGLVIGDVNQNNVLVTRDALVKLIDVDSFQITAKDDVFLCKVGVAHFTPPELQSASLATIRRTTSHDSFGLSILAFHLLFMGRHPFAGRYGGREDMPIERAICESRFAYGSQAATLRMQPPPHAIELADCTATVATLFERAFNSSTSRPTAKEWSQALAAAEASLQPCSEDPGHFILSIDRGCPWCRIEQKGAPQFFFSVTLGRLKGRLDHVDPGRLWSQIEDVSPPSRQIVFPSRSAASRLTPAPVPLDIGSHEQFTGIVGTIALAALLAIPFALGVELVLLCASIIGTVFAVWWMVLFMLSPLRAFCSERHRKANQAKQALAGAVSDFRATLAGHEQQFQSEFARLARTKQDLSKLDSLKQSELSNLSHQARERQLDEFLERCAISANSISGIGPARAAALASYGITSALDIRMIGVENLPGFGPALQANLLAWLTFNEQGFVFNARAALPQSAVQSIEMKYYQHRYHGERILQHGMQSLRECVRNAESACAPLARSVERFDRKSAQLTAR